MSKNTVTTGVAAGETNAPRKPKKRVQKVRLPTPPPDPRNLPETKETNKTTQDESPTSKEAEFLDYLENLQKCNRGLARSTSLFAPTIAAEDAFDHLEKLYKLMEQMLALREQNAKLHRRIRDLEHLRNMHKQIDQSELLECIQDFDKDSAFAESLLDTILLGTKRETKPSKFSASHRIRQSILRRQRHRGGSVTIMDKTSEYDFSGADRRSSAVITPSSDKSAKVSKWTKVKEAFKWEKAASQVSGIKTPESDSGLVPLNYEVARYLRVPSTSEDLGSSPVDSGAAGISTPGTISSASSLEDLHYGRKGDYSSDDDHYPQHDYIPQYKKNQSKATASRTRWAKMKDIIQPRSSIKKRYRLSAKSDDYKNYESDNEDVFLTDPNPSPSPGKNKLEKSKSFPDRSHHIPPEVIERYQTLIAEEMLNKTDPELKTSRWTRVKKAFLTSSNVNKQNEDENANIQATSNMQDSYKSTLGDYRLQAEIERSYKQLQKKLSLEFHDKVLEWEKNKLNSPGHNACSSATGSVLSSDDVKDQAFIKKMEEWEKIKSHAKVPMTSEGNLPPEFRKKLQEWQKIKKSARDDQIASTSKKKIGDLPKCKSVGGYKTENSPLDQKPLSTDFLKKLEAWKQMKAGALPYPEDSDSKRHASETKTPSPRMARKDSSSRQSKKFKEQTDKELQWFEKELSKIEREKQRLERERQKFLEREERLSKLRKSVIGNNKQEVFVHTPTGFYRFEGISRKFTQKLYEWEKAQGIGPEASTFALLTSNCSPDFSVLPTIKRDSKTSNLYRSKSADSIANSVQNLVCPILSEQPSSLSLNEFDLETNCMESRLSSMRDVIRSNENIGSDEPEAVIVEVEDVYEETAAPLVTFFDKEETPVYQHQQENQKLCEGKKNSGPKIRRSESTRAQTNYNLIEDTIAILRRLTDIEKDVEDVENEFLSDDPLMENNQRSTTLEDKKLNLKNSYEVQTVSSRILIEKVTQLQQENSTVAANINTECGPHLAEILDNIQDLSSEVIQLGEKLRTDLENRNKNGPQDDSTNYTKANYPNISFSLKLLNSKLLEIRRELSYICAASDLTAPGKKRKCQKRGILRRKSEEGEESSSKKYYTKKKSTSNVEDSSSSMDAPIPVGQGAIRKRIKYRQKEPSFYKVVNESDENETDYREQRKVKQKRFSRSRSGSEGTSTEVNETVPKPEDILVDPEIVQKVVVPTKTNFVNSEGGGLEPDQPDSPVTIFVKTTRKLFTPIATASLGGENAEETKLDKDSEGQKVEETIDEDEDAKVKAEEQKSQKPPLPSSPVVQRKVLKEISPSIRIMMVKYNQKVAEQENGGCHSAGSSGSASPTTWRSPVSERRVRAQTEKYQEEINKLSPLLKRREVQKSASVGLLYSGKKQVTVHGKAEETSPETSPRSNRGILKSTSINVLSGNGQNSKVIQEKISVNPLSHEVRASLKLTMPLVKESSSPSQEISDDRKLKLKIAKENFFNSSAASPGASPVSAPTPSTSTSKNMEYPKSRLSQVSMGSESSYDSNTAPGWLVKSASAGMINVEPDVYKQFDPAFHEQGYVSLPRSNRTKPKESFLSNITSKFRKVKMRRNKDPSKMNTISTLCRQSLVVDIGSDSQENIATKQSTSDSSKVTSDSSSKDYLSVPSDSNRGSSSEDMSGESSRSGRWLPRPRIFKSSKQ